VDGLALHPDVPAGARHGVIEPAFVQPLAAFQASLAGTRDGWSKIPEEP
jgi:hypothetical protein